MYLADSVTQISLRRQVIQHDQCQARNVIDGQDIEERCRHHMGYLLLSRALCSNNRRW